MQGKLFAGLLGVACQVFNYTEGICYMGTLATVDRSRTDNATGLLWRPKGIFSLGKMLPFFNPKLLDK